MGKCTYCGNDAGFLRGKHKACQQTRDAGWNEMVEAATRVAQGPDFSETALASTLAGVAERSWMGEDDVRAAIAEGWSIAVRESLADGVLTQEEETRLRVFRDGMAAQSGFDDSAESDLEQASRKRLVNQARLAALSVGAPDAAHDEVSAALDHSAFSPEEQRAILIEGWAMAVSHALEDDLLSLDEEAALTRYMERFNLGQDDLNEHGAFRNFVKAGVIREVANGVIPSRQSIARTLPMNFQKSERLVWVFDGVDYYEVKTRRQRRGTSHGVSVRVAKGLYYSPRTFSSQTHEWDETVHLDTGLMAVTTKHIYFHGGSKRFRIRYDKIVSFDQYSDGIGIMRDAQTAKPQTFRNGDGWFVYNLVTNLARM